MKLDSGADPLRRLEGFHRSIRLPEGSMRFGKGEIEKGIPAVQ